MRQIFFDTETTGLEARTIHRLLEFDPQAFGFRRNAELPLAQTVCTCHS